MKNDDRNMGGAGQKDNYGKQTPGRKQEDDLSTGQKGAGQKGEPGHMKDSEKSGQGQGGRQGGQNR
jgi:hypothetical protein